MHMANICKQGVEHAFFSIKDLITKMKHIE